MAAAFAADGGDPRTAIAGPGRPNTFIAPQHRLLHDPAVTFEEYIYYAERTRVEEEELAKREPPTTTFFHIIFPPKSTLPFVEESNGASSPDGEYPSEKEKGAYGVHVVDANLSDKHNRLRVTDAEWTNASRAFRTASWAACFYLITTDILGPFGIG